MTHFLTLMATFEFDIAYFSTTIITILTVLVPYLFSTITQLSNHFQTRWTVSLMTAFKTATMVTSEDFLAWISATRWCNSTQYWRI